MNCGANWRGTLRRLSLASIFAVLPSLASAQVEKPQYGGILNIGMVYLTLSPLSWDPADWS